MRIRAALSIATTVLAVLAPSVASAAPSPSPSPTSPSAPAPATSSSAAPGGGYAQSAANDAARGVARVQHSILDAQRTLTRAVRDADAAQRRLTAQLAVQQRAEADAAVATRTAATLRTAYDKAHAAFIALVTASYEQGGVGSFDSMTSLLLSPSPTDVLRAEEDRELIAKGQADVISQDQQAATAYHRVQAQADRSLEQARRATASLTTLRDRARSSLDRSTAALRTLQRELVAAKTTQARADAVLSQFLGGWSLADPSRATALNRHYLDVARSADGTSPAAVAVVRALRQIGAPYAWAGGNAQGPTQGQCAGGGAAHDCHVVGYDCSGLVLYAWAPALALPHLASAQYTAAGRLHPAVDKLRPGDLVFWSSDGTVAGIHHVALYVGDGNIVQAPQSGDIVRVTPLGNVDAGYFGATRPLS